MKIVRCILEITNRPGLLLFTAPYKLCEGGCKDSKSDNFVISFPLFIGKTGKKFYQDLYNRDFKNIHDEGSNAPFKKRTFKTPFTTSTTVTCPTTVTVDNVTDKSVSTTNSFSINDTIASESDNMSTKSTLPLNLTDEQNKDPSPDTEAYMDALKTSSPPEHQRKCADVTGLCWKRIKNKRKSTDFVNLEHYDNTDISSQEKDLFDIEERMFVG